MTPLHYRVYGFVADFIRDEGYSPSYAEIAKGLRLKSSSLVFAAIHRLKEEGLVTFLPHRSRSIRIVDRNNEVIAAAERLLDSIVFENEERGLAVVQAAAIADLDLLLGEIRPREARTARAPACGPAQSDKGETI